MQITNRTKHYQPSVDKHHISFANPDDKRVSVSRYNSLLIRALYQYYECENCNGTTLFYTFTHNDRSCPRIYGIPCVSSSLIRKFTNRQQIWLKDKGFTFRYLVISEYDSCGVRDYNPHYHSLMYIFDDKTKQPLSKSLLNEFIARIFEFFQGTHFHYSNYEPESGFTREFFEQATYKNDKGEIKHFTEKDPRTYKVGLVHSGNNRGVVTSYKAIKYCLKYCLKHSSHITETGKNPYDLAWKELSKRIDNNKKLRGDKENYTKAKRKLMFQNYFRYKVSNSLGLNVFLNGSQAHNIPPFKVGKNVVFKVAFDGQMKEKSLPQCWHNHIYKTPIKVYSSTSKTGVSYIYFNNYNYLNSVKVNYQYALNNKIDAIRDALNYFNENQKLFVDNSKVFNCLTTYGYFSPYVITRLANYINTVRFRLIPRELVLTTNLDFYKFHIDNITRGLYESFNFQIDYVNGVALPYPIYEEEISSVDISDYDFYFDRFPDLEELAECLDFISDTRSKFMKLDNFPKDNTLKKSYKNCSIKNFYK